MDIIEKIESGELKGYLTINRRIIFEGAIYHITQRAPGRELIFVEDKDYLVFLSILKKTVEKFNLQLFCFALLPNHLHLLLKIREKNLSLAMKSLFEKYARYFNLKYKRKGHVFCGRFRASLCNHEDYFLAASVYIHLNAYKAGLCKHIADYRWSSVGLYLGEISKETFVDYKEILLLLDEGNMQRARSKYIEILEDCAKIRAEIFVGSSFAKKFIKRACQIMKKIVNRSTDLDELIDRFQQNKSVNTPEDKNARKYLIQQLTSRGYSVTKISRMLSISRNTVYRVIKS